MLKNYCVSSFQRIPSINTNRIENQKFILNNKKKGKTEIQVKKKNYKGYKNCTHKHTNKSIRKLYIFIFEFCYAGLVMLLYMFVMFKFKIQSIVNCASRPMTMDGHGAHTMNKMHYTHTPIHRNINNYEFGKTTQFGMILFL